MRRLQPDPSTATFTVLGGDRGFIGTALVRHLRAVGAECIVPGRSDADLLRRPLHHVIDCTGVTSDFRARPFDTIRAHVCRLVELLERARFDSFLYLSSTRVYLGSPAGLEEADLFVEPSKPTYVYNLSKLMGEAACHAHGSPTTRIARLSNVFGEGMGSEGFLSSLIRGAAGGSISLRTPLDASKDYIALADVVEILPRIAISGHDRVYNVASGVNVSNRAIVNELQRVTGCDVGVEADAHGLSFPEIVTDRIEKEFSFTPRSLLGELEGLLHLYQGRDAL